MKIKRQFKIVLNSQRNKYFNSLSQYILCALLHCQQEDNFVKNFIASSRELCIKNGEKEEKYWKEMCIKKGIKSMSADA